MKLKELLLYEKNGYIIRKIEFNLNGPSLIVDETDISSNKESGSSIGKTTAVLIIDICLGKKDVKAIYDSNDASGSNQFVKTYLNDQKVTAELTVVHGEQEYVLRRGLYSNGVMAIGEIEYRKLEEYNLELKKLFFGNELSKPGVRELIPFFVRIENISEKIYLKYLPSVSDNARYQAFYSSLFHLDWFDVSNLSIIEDNKKDKNYIKAMLARNNVKNLNVLAKRIELVKREVEQLKQYYNNFEHLEHYKKNEKEFLKLEQYLKDMEQQYQEVCIQISNLDSRINNMNIELSQNDLKALDLLIKDTRSVLKPDFEVEIKNAIEFYQKTQEKQKSILQSQLDDKREREQTIYDQLNASREIYAEQYRGFSSSLADEYEKKYNEFTKKNSDLMRAQLDYEEILKLEDNYVEPSGKYENAEKINKKIEVFNKYFSKFTKQSINREAHVVYNLTSIKPEKGTGFVFPFDIAGSEGNMGTSKSKVITGDFVFSYIQYAREHKLTAPEFFIADKLENIDLKELTPLIQMSRENDIQFIFPILSDRVEQSNIILEKDIVLKLSQGDKLFKI